MQTVVVHVEPYHTGTAGLKKSKKGEIHGRSTDCFGKARATA